MLAKMPIEGGAIRVRQGFGLAPDDPAATPLEVTYAQGREIGRDEAGQLLKRGIDEGGAGHALLGEDSQRTQGGMQITLGYPGEDSIHAKIQPQGQTVRERG